MKLYHVSFNLTENRRFEPRIPESRNGDEDSTIPRVCLAETVEGALSAIPDGGSELDFTLEKNQNFIKLFIVDTDKLNIKEENIIDYNELYALDLVIDANHTKEYWILESFEVPEEDTYIAHIKNYDYASRDYVPYFIEQETLSREDGALEEVWEEYFPFENLPCITVIEDLEYDIVDLDSLNFSPYTTDWYEEKYNLKSAKIDEYSTLIKCPLNSYLIARYMVEDLKELEEGIVFIEEWV